MCSRGPNEPAGVVIREAVDLLTDDDPSPEQAEVFGLYALFLQLEDEDPRSVLAAADRAIGICGRLGLPEPAIAISCRGLARFNLGDVGGVEDYERALAAARAQGLGIERATIEINYAGVVQSVKGALAARDVVVEALDFARSHGLEAYVVTCRGSLVQILLDMGPVGPGFGRGDRPDAGARRGRGPLGRAPTCARYRRLSARGGVSLAKSPRIWRG